MEKHRTKVAFEAVIRECARDLPPIDLLARIADRLRTAIAWDKAGWLLLDPQTLLVTGGIRPQCPPQDLSRLLENEFRQEDVLKFRTLACSPHPAATLWQATHGQPERSPRYRRIHASLDLGDELRAVFRTGGTCLGAVQMVRRAGEAPFSAADTALATAVGRHIAEALRRSLLTFGALPAGEEAAAGMLLLDSQDTLESQTPQAARLLSQAGRVGHESLPLPAAVYSVAHRARAIAAGHGAGPRPASRLTLADGRWLHIEAAPLDGPDGGHGRVAVVLQPAGSAHLAPLVLRLGGLTAREDQVARLLLRGETTERIAQLLVISRHTARDHVKAIFAKLGVTSRPEFTALLTHDAAGGVRRSRSPGG